MSSISAISAISAVTLPSHALADAAHAATGLAGLFQDPVHAMRRNQGDDTGGGSDPQPKPKDYHEQWLLWDPSTVVVHHATPFDQLASETMPPWAALLSR